jgi:hypothetical protein
MMTRKLLVTGYDYINMFWRSLILFEVHILKLIKFLDNFRGLKLIIEFTPAVLLNYFVMFLSLS